VSLITKLIKVDKTEEELGALDRDALMNVWALVVAEGKDKSPAAAVGGETKFAIGYDVGLEGERLVFERKKVKLDMEGFEKGCEEKEKERDLNKLKIGVGTFNT
jgi:hypothetical protein